MAKYIPKYDWIGLKTAWMMSKQATLGEFFAVAAQDIPANTWKKHTSTWHYERTRYREELSKQTLETFKADARKVVVRHQKMNQVAWTLVFGDLIQTVDPKTGKNLAAPRLRPGLSNSEKIRLLELCQRHEIDMANFSKMLANMDVSPADTTRQDAPAVRAKLQAIIADPKALEGVGAILDAIQAEEPRA